MKEIHLHAPSGWGELAPDQLLYVAKLFEDKLPVNEFLTRLLIYFTGIKQVVPGSYTTGGNVYICYVTRDGEPFDLTPDEVYSLIKRLNWVIDSVGLCRLPEKLGSLVPVDSRLFGVSLEEYLLADQCYAAYHASRSMADLDRFVAVVYREPDTKWSEKKYILNIQLVAKLESNSKIAVFLWFAGLKKWIVAKYPYLFDGGTATEIQPVGQDEHILRLLTSLNNGDVTRNRAILRTHVHEVFYELNQKIENQPANV